MPAHVRPGVRFLDPHRGVIDEDVGPDHVLDRVEYLRMVHQRVGPLVEQVRLALLGKVERMALPALPVFQIGTQLTYLVRREDRHGKCKAVLPVSFDLRG